MTTEEMLFKMAQDIGYIKGVVKPLADARIVERLAAIEHAATSLSEELDEVRIQGRRRFNAAIGILGTVGAFSSAIVAALLYLSGGS